MKTFVRFVSVTTIVASALFVTGAGIAGALDDVHVEFPAGLACEGFAVIIDGTGGNAQQRTVANGRIITVGTGSNLTFTNGSTGAMYFLKSKGGGDLVTQGTDGSAHHTAVGNTILVLFPTDTPAGPSTQLIVGRLVFDVDTQQNFTLVSTSGKTVDICAALS